MSNPSPDRIIRHIRSLTDDALEREILTSTPKGDVSSRLLELDFRGLLEVDFHVAGRLIGACEGFARRGGMASITAPQSRADAEEARRLSQVINSATPSTVRQLQVNLARMVQKRSRAARFLGRVGFIEAVRCDHLSPNAVFVRSDVTSSDASFQAITVTRESLPRSSAHVEVAPFRWLSMSSPEEFEKANTYIASTLQQLGIGRSMRHAVLELAQNVYEHSLFSDEQWTSVASQHVLFGVATYEAQGRTLANILIVDGGVGIPITLASDFQRALGRDGTQAEVLQYAFDISSTRKPRTHVKGVARGLAFVRTAVRNANGSMIVRSGTGELQWGPEHAFKLNMRPGFQPGTAFSLSIPIVRPRNPPLPRNESDEDVSQSLDIEVELVGKNGSIRILDSPAHKFSGQRQEVSFLFVEPAGSRFDLERSIAPHLEANEILLVGSSDGRGELLRDQLEAILTGKKTKSSVKVIVLDGLNPTLMAGRLSSKQVNNLLRSVIERLGSELCAILKDVIEETPITPRCTWSLKVASQWIEPKVLLEDPAIRILAPVVLAYASTKNLVGTPENSFTVLDVIVTDTEFLSMAEAVSGWLGAQYVRRIRVPQEPDSALLVDEIEAASVILSPIIHGGGSTVPIIRGLLTSGRRSISVCCLIDSQASPGAPLVVAGHRIPVVSGLSSVEQPSPEIEARMRADSMARLESMLTGEDGDTEVFAAIAASPGSLQLGHFHTENRAWMSTVITPRAIGDASTAIGALILQRLADELLDEIKRTHPNAYVELRDLAGETQLTSSLRAVLLGRHEGDLRGGVVTVLVDWGALTGETVVRGAIETARTGVAGVIVAVGVDRAYQGAHHLLSRSSLSVTTSRPGELPGVSESVEVPVQLSFISAVRFPRDHRNEVDCPLCATERSLVRVRSLPTSVLNSRIRMLRVKTASDLLGAETLDAFHCEMSPSEVRRFLTWRAVLYAGMGDSTLGYGVVLMVEGVDAALHVEDLIALSRNFALNGDLLKRRPWSSPRFRHALASALSRFLMSSDALGISSNMARQLITVLRMSSKTVFVRESGRLYQNWRATDVREELEVGMSTLLRDNMSVALLESANSAVSLFDGVATAGEVSLSRGALKAEIYRVKGKQHGASDRAYRWKAARELMAALPTHMGIGRETARLPALVAALPEP